MKIKELDLLEFGTANKKILDFTKSSKKITDEELNSLLKLNGNELKATFLENFNQFSDNQLEILRGYVNTNLDIDDRDYISDLIDFSTTWVLDINYQKLLSFLTNDEESNHFVVLSTINYIIENIKLFYVKEIVNSMKKIINNPNYYHNVQILAGLCLFRVTQNKKYLLEIKNWFDIDENKEFVNNNLKSVYYKKEYFPDIKSILGNGTE